MPFSIDEEPESYSSFKKRKFNQYEEKAIKLFRGIDDLSLKPVDRTILKNKLIERLENLK